MADTGNLSTRRGNKSAEAFRTISEVATGLDVPQHVLRFWETKFSQVRPMKRGGGRRYYRPEDVELLRSIRILSAQTQLAKVPKFAPRLPVAFVGLVLICTLLEASSLLERPPL